MLAAMTRKFRAPERFVGEPIRPVASTGDAAMMVRGGPGLPRRFWLPGRQYEVEAILQTHRTAGPCTSGSAERYVRKHWFTFRTTTGETMTVYFDRQARRGLSPKARWWLFSMTGSPPGAAATDISTNDD